MASCKLFSQRDHPISLSYDGEGMQLPPRGELLIENKEKLGAVPKGVVLVLIRDEPVLAKKKTAKK